MPLPTDIRPVGFELFLLPVTLRVPLKIGPLVIESLVCLRARVTVRDRAGRVAYGWGETPLSAQWAWPSAIPPKRREQAMIDLAGELARAWLDADRDGHPLELGHDFEQHDLHRVTHAFNQGPRRADEPLPHLASLVANASLDIALHDAFGNLHGVDIYDTYNARWISRDLSRFFTDDPATASHMAGRYPADFVLPREQVPTTLPVWHAVGGSDAIDPADLTGHEPRDGYPVLLPDWVRRDGLRCLKIKLRGYDAAWDRARMDRIARLADELDVQWLSPDFNCTVTDPGYVNDLLDRLRADQPRAFEKILYVEQPFPYDLEKHRIDVHSVSQRKPLFMDESAHDWRLIRLGRELGWTGVALKTCKTQTGALLSLCWARAHGMSLMVQDLTNPMLAIIPHVRLAAHAGTIMGVECNACQFYPTASDPESVIHTGLYERRDGVVDLSTIHGPGFGCRTNEIRRTLGEPALAVGSSTKR